jgi:ElaB/YqjD/DUF883 family membrane-anchored ribosome-binding protein
MSDLIDQSNVTKEKLIADLKVVIADAEELLKVTASQAGEKVGELRIRMQENLSSARLKLADAEAALKEKSRERRLRPRPPVEVDRRRSRCGPSGRSSDRSPLSARCPSRNDRTVWAYR